MKEKRLYITEHFTQQMTSQSNAEMIKYYFYKLKMHKQEQPQVIQTLERSLEAMTPKILLDTVKELRSFSYHKESKWEWLEWNQRELTRSDWEKPSIFWLWLTAHPNGYIRELAWEKLANVAVNYKLVFLLLTLNDNVEVLRKLAVQQLLKQDSFSTEEMVFSLPFIQRLGGLGHSENRPIQKYMIQLLFEQPELLLEAQHSEDVFIYRYAFELSYSSESTIQNESIQNGFEKSDKLTLARTFREFLRTSKDKEQQVKKLLTHGQPNIRKLASIWCYNHLENDEAMIPLLLDSTSSVRYLTRDYINKYFPGFDMRAYYLKHLSTHEVSVIQGLAMLQDKRDRDVMLAKLADPRKKVRLAVLGWIGCLSQKEQFNYYIAGLSDIARDVRKKSAILLGEFYPHFYPEIRNVLCEQFKTAKEYKHQITTLIALANGTRKEYLFDLFELYPYSLNELVQEEIIERIYSWEHEWNRRFYIAFTETEKEHLMTIGENVDRLDIGMFLTK